MLHQRDSKKRWVRYTMDRPRFSEHLEAIKFICKDFWSELFKKQIDNLKTNHRVDLETCNSEHLNFEIRNVLISCAYPSLQPPNSWTLYTMDRPRFSEHLEAIKFICKDFWSELFKKQIDNLKTNHRVDLETCNTKASMFPGQIVRELKLQACISIFRVES